MVAFLQSSLIIFRIIIHFYELVDSFIVFEGEHALLGLIEQLDGKKDFY